MNEIVKPKQYGRLNFIKKKKSIMTGCLRKSIWQLMQLSNSGKSIWKAFDQMETKYWRSKNDKYTKQLARMIKNNNNFRNLAYENIIIIIVLCDKDNALCNYY